MTWLIRLFGLLFIGLTTAALAAELPKEPQLRIDGGMHTATIRRLDVSADGKILVTGSEDKTVRVWSLPDGQLLRTLRLPVAPGDPGKVYAVAISPDGKLVAAGGFDDVDETSLDYYVYIFDRQTGQLLRRFGPHGQVIDELTFSPDDQRLAVGLGGQAGFVLWDMAEGRQILSDNEYGEAVNGVAFSPAGDIAVSSHDGKLRLYSASLEPLIRTPAPSGERPEGIAFSPDGSKLAIGYVGAMALDILNSSDLSLLYQADTKGLDIGDVAAVAWSADGQTVFAAGDYYTRGGKEERMQTFAWGDQGRGKRRAFDAAGNTVMDIKATPQGGAAIADANGGFTVYDAKGDIVLRKTSAAADFRGELGKAFTVSEDGTRVRVGIGIEAEDPWLFDAMTLRFTESPKPPGDLKPANVTKLKVENWNSADDNPTVNGAPLQLDPNDRSRSLAIEEDGETLVLGTNFALRRYTKKATVLWRLGVPAIPWGVNITAKDQLLITANTDGTIRWYRLADGAELLALFVNAVDKRWIAWTPTGYYAASPGGEDLIGWQVNHGFDEAPDFFPASQFHDQFYRPDIVREVFETFDEGQAITAANAKAKRPNRKDTITDALPPVIDIVNPVGGTAVSEPLVTFSYRVRTPDGKAPDEIEVLIDGRPQGQRGAAVVTDDDTQSLDITIPARDVEVSLIAKQGDAVSVPARVKLKWAGPPSEDQIKRKLYAVFVGVSDYDKAGLKLNFADDDARDFSQSEASQKGRLYETADIKLLTDKQATAENIRSGLGWLEDKVGPEDIGLLFMAGHGITDAKQRFYFLPVGGDPEDLRSTGISESEIREAISSVAGKVVFFIDACHSADSLKGDAAQADVTGVVNRMARADSGVIMFASSGGNELSLERSDWKNGAFTEALLQGITGGADYEKDGDISTAELNLWLTTQVKKLTQNRQNAVMVKPDTVPDFSIARLR